MKQAIARFLEKTRLNRTRLYFYVQYWRQVRTLHPDLKAEGVEDILETLDRDGIIVIPDFFTKEQCDRLLKVLDVAFEQVKAGTFSGQYQYNHEKLVRTGHTDESIPETNEFFDHPFLEKIAKAYIDPRAYAYRKESELRDNLNAVQQADTFHFDDWRMRFKFFLYLTDVGPDNAPFAYLTRTHKQFTGRRKKDIEYERDGQVGAYGHFHPQEVRELRRLHPECEEIVCEGKAGTLIIADFRGLHRGSPLKSGRRVLLNATYGI